MVGTRTAPLNYRLAMGALARDFKQRPGGQKAYIGAKFVAGPLGVVLVTVGGMGHHHAVLVAGIVSLGLFFLDTLLVFPIMRARHDLKRGRARSRDSN
jgi:hypothetical protein